MKAGFVSSVLILLACWYLYEPIPSGFSQPWKLRAVWAGVKVVMDASWIAETLGLVPAHEVLRFAEELRTSNAPEKRAKDLVLDGIPVRAYNVKDSGPNGRYPGLVYYHGGGWALSSTKKYDRLMLGILEQIDIIIVSVDYRLAGKDGVRYPEPLDDCLTATKYFLTHCSTLFGVDPERVAIGGDSAGGNLAAAVALKLRDEHFSPMPKLQVLIYPVLQAVDFLLPSMVQNKHGPILTRYWLAKFCQLYATGSTEHVSQMLNNNHTSQSAKTFIYDRYIRHEDLELNYHYKPYKKPRLDFGNDRLWSRIKDVMMSPYFAPLLAENLADLPETYLYTPHYDVLRDEGILYSRRLKAAGVPVSHVEDPTAFHGICSWRRWFPVEGERCMNGITDFLNGKI
ncbi:hypothetical protein LSH36_133g05074 [Paralvinella palmiformis]|uniref:Alpha/beta hydrolase fold-3 domain-containing protein n=1 Tax=Paralvinella palmiformis TaxID=53620 RepID=A0AAD9JWS0_9ANNE|nr:hypothetical protein LSH36_133g05074 [Paralvinella palmiformis]